MVDLLLEGNADPTLINDKNETAYSLANKSGRKLVALLVAEACVLRKLHSFDDDAHDHIMKNIKEGESVS
jgi:hypothetical protein